MRYDECVDIKMTVRSIVFAICDITSTNNRKKIMVDLTIKILESTILAYIIPCFFLTHQFKS